MQTLLTAGITTRYDLSALQCEIPIVFLNWRVERFRSMLFQFSKMKNSVIEWVLKFFSLTIVANLSATHPSESHDNHQNFVTTSRTFLLPNKSSSGGMVRSTKWRRRWSIATVSLIWRGNASDATIFWHANRGSRRGRVGWCIFKCWETDYQSCRLIFCCTDLATCYIVARWWDLLECDFRFITV